MAFTVLPPQRTWGEAFGQGFENSLANTLNLLAQTKSQQLLQQQKSSLNQPLIKQLLQQYGLDTTATEQQSQQTVFEQPLAQTSSIQGQPQQIQQLLQPLAQQQAPIRSQVETLFPGQTDLIMNAVRKGMSPEVPKQNRLQEQPPIQNIIQTPKEPSLPVQQLSQALQAAQPAKKLPLSQTQAMQLATALSTGDMRQILETQRSIDKENATQARFERKQEQAERQEATETYKITKEGREKILEEGRTARENLNNLDRMSELNKTGKLDTPGYVEFLKNSGLDIPALMNPESEEFQKIAQTFMRDAKKYFGGRVSNFEIEQFLKTVPSLSQSPAGRNRVISNLKRFNKAAVFHSRSMKDLVKENKGRIPLDYQEQLDDLLESKSEQFAKEFKDDLAKPVPEGQSRWITGLQATAGGLLGAPGKIISKVAGAAGKLLGA